MIRYLLQSAKQKINRMLTSALHLLLSGRLNISSLNSAPWAARESERNWVLSTAESQYHVINKSWQELQVYAHHTHTHKHTNYISHTHTITAVTVSSTPVANCPRFPVVHPHPGSLWTLLVVVYYHGKNSDLFAAVCAHDSILLLGMISIHSYVLKIFQSVKISCLKIAETSKHFSVMLDDDF